MIQITQKIHQKYNLSGIALLGTYLFSKLSEVVLNIIIIIEIDK